MLYELNARDFKSEEVLKLKCGASLVRTPAGWIQFGLPPGFLSELLSQDHEIPTYFIIPTIRFHKKYAVNLADFAYPAYYNYLRGMKTYLICNPLVPLHLRTIFKEAWPIWDDSVIHKDIDFYASIDKNPVPNFVNEFTYLRSKFTDHCGNKNLIFEEMLDYIVIDKKTGS